LVIWPGGRVSADAVLDRCIVFSTAAAGERHHDADL